LFITLHAVLRPLGPVALWRQSTTTRAVEGTERAWQKTAKKINSATRGCRSSRR
jgi:hypothetical protein